MIARDVADRVWAMNVWKQSVHRLYEALQNPHVELRFQSFAVIYCKPHVASSICLRATIFQNPEWTLWTHCTSIAPLKLQKCWFLFVKSRISRSQLYSRLDRPYARSGRCRLAYHPLFEKRITHRPLFRKKNTPTPVLEINNVTHILPTFLGHSPLFQTVIRWRPS
jgi:hypothetical protein